MAGERGQKLLPEGSDALAGLTAQYRGIQANLIRHIALGPNNGSREEARVAFPEADVASAELRVYTIEDDDVMGVDSVAIAEARVLFLSCGVPNVEDHRAMVGVELNGEDLCTNGGLVNLLKLVIDLAVEESALANATIAHKDNLIRRGRHSL
jgi:hypothetical protein